MLSVSQSTAAAVQDSAPAPGDLGDLPATESTGRAEVQRLVAAARHAAATDAATAVAADRDGGRGATAHLARLLASTPAIEQAKGLLIGYYGVDADTAYAVLRRWSSHTNTKLNQLAEQLVETASHSSDRPFSQLQTLLTTFRPALDPHQVVLEARTRR